VFVVNSLAQYLSNLGYVHIQDFKHTIWYIKITSNYGIKNQKSKNDQILHGYFDANWVVDNDIQHSTFVYCFTLVEGIVS